MTARPRRSSPKPSASSSRRRSFRSSTTTGFGSGRSSRSTGLGSPSGSSRRGGAAARGGFGARPPHPRGRRPGERGRAAEGAGGSEAARVEPALPREVRVKRGLVFGKFLPLHRGHQARWSGRPALAGRRPHDRRLRQPPARTATGVGRAQALRRLRELYQDVENILALEDPLAGPRGHGRPGLRRGVRARASLS